MVLLAYTIFTTTLVLQRKQAARDLALGLASLTIPLVPLLAPQPADRRGDLRRVARAAPVPRPAAPRGPDLPERAVRPAFPARIARRDGTLSLLRRPSDLPPISRHNREQTQPPAPAARQSAIDRPSRPPPPPSKPASTGAASTGAASTAPGRGDGPDAGAGSTAPGGSPAGATATTGSDRRRATTGSEHPSGHRRASRPARAPAHRLPAVVHGALPDGRSSSCAAPGRRRAHLASSSSSPPRSRPTPARPSGRPAPTASPAAGATPALGYVQPRHGPPARRASATR